MPRRETPKGASVNAPKEGGKVESLRGARPWGDFAKKYFMAGWCPLPLPPRKKSSPPTGTTGRYDMPDRKKIQGWARDRDARCNIAVRVPDNVIGLDVDAYDAKVGRASLAELVREFGELPETWTLTSRSDGVSGIRFYRVPTGMHWPGEPRPDVQIVQNHHRYAVAYPSVHPDTRGVYLWYGPGDPLNGAPRSVSVEHEIPAIDELPELPAEWIEGLTSGRLWAELPADLGASRSDILDWVKARPSSIECRLMRKQADAAVEEIGVGGAHDALNSRVYALIALASEGHSGLDTALSRVRASFTTEVTRPGRKGRRGRREAASEFLRIRDGAVRIMMASVADGESRLEEDCACAGGSIEWGEKLGVEVAEDASSAGSGKRGRLGKAKPADKYTFDDSGNAEHMLDIIDGSAYWVSGEKCWFFWNGTVGAWQPDASGSRALNAAQLVGKRCRELSDDYLEKLKSAGSSFSLDSGGDVSQKIGQLDKHAKVSSDRRGLESMVKIASAQARAERRAEDFDFRRDLLACPNGTLELLSDGIRFRAAARSDFLSVSTTTPFVPDATCWAWDAYLDKFVPDLDVRRYVQKIAGYSLYGENPERKMFFLQGGTSTGKSTFGKALSSALGQHAGTMNLSLFRDSQDEKPRPDLVRALTRRVLVAYESSQEWHLHGDQIKRLTGADPIRARILYASVYVDRLPCFTPWVVTNSMPQVHGADKALFRRLVRVPFEVAVAEGQEDFRITAALESLEGRSAVLAWAVRGWEMYRQDGGLEAPDAVLAATAEMLEELTDIDVFLKEVTVPDENGRIPSGDLFERFMMWAETNNVDAKKMSSNKFGRELTGRGFGIQSTTIRREKVKVRTGLRWRK
jgi:putative DNA primase/helicase